MSLSLNDDGTRTVEMAAVLHDISFLPCYIDGSARFAIIIDSIGDLNRFVGHLAMQHDKQMDSLIGSDCYTLPINTSSGHLAGLVWPTVNGYQFAQKAAQTAIANAMSQRLTEPATGLLRLHIVSLLSHDIHAGTYDGEHWLLSDLDEAASQFASLIDGLDMRPEIAVPDASTLYEIKMSYLDATADEIEELQSHTVLEVIEDCAPHAAHAIINMRTETLACLPIVCAVTSSADDVTAS